MKITLFCFLFIFQIAVGQVDSVTVDLDRLDWKYTPTPPKEPIFLDSLFIWYDQYKAECWADSTNHECFYVNRLRGTKTIWVHRSFNGLDDNFMQWLDKKRKRI